jgi:hypothetical protein
MQREHGVLIRQLGGLQTRVSLQMQACYQQVDDLERALMDARAQLLMVRTALLWGLGRESLTWTSTGKNPLQRRVAQPDLTTGHLIPSDGVICQTGCVGHAHPWLEPDGQCRRTGQSCERLAGDPGPARPEDGPQQARSGAGPDLPVVVKLTQP